MNLVVDIGNTRVKAAVFDDSELIEIIKVPHEEKSKIGDIIDQFKPKYALVSSVADLNFDASPIFENSNVNMRYFDNDTRLPISTEYEGTTLGKDRIADAVAIYSLSKANYKLIIDTGTCITYNYVFGNIFKGGGISPGLMMRYKALNHFTGRLPLIQKRKTTEIIGNSTAKSIQSGVVNGMQAEIQGLCNEFLDRYPDGEIFITGGDSIFFAEGLKNSIFADPNLTLKGLNEILVFNEK